MSPDGSKAIANRVFERRRAVALARHYREFEGLSIVQIAHRLGRSPATVNAYFYDPTGEKARAVKARYVGVCRGCGTYTQPRNGKGDAYAYCKACHPGAIKPRWTGEQVLDAMREWRPATGGCRRHATGRERTRAGAGERRSRGLPEGNGRHRAVVTRLFGTWAIARATARWQNREVPTSLPASATSPLGSNSISLPKPRESTATSANPRGGARHYQPSDFQVFLSTTQNFAHYSGR